MRRFSQQNTKIRANQFYPPSILTFHTAVYLWCIYHSTSIHFSLGYLQALRSSLLFPFIPHPSPLISSLLYFLSHLLSFPFLPSPFLTSPLIFPSLSLPPFSMMLFLSSQPCLSSPPCSSLSIPLYPHALCSSSTHILFTLYICLSILLHTPPFSSYIFSFLFLSCKLLSSLLPPFTTSSLCPFIYPSTLSLLLVYSLLLIPRHNSY